MHLYTTSTVRMHINTHTHARTHARTHADDPDNFNWTYIVIDETLYFTKIYHYH